MLHNCAAAVFDTHAWVWFCAGDKRMASWQDFSGRIILSAISLWEVSMLAEKGRLALEPDVQTWLTLNSAFPIEIEPLTIRICAESARLNNFHGDPADRLIVATALSLGLPLVTTDHEILTWAKSSRRLRVAP